MAYMHAPTSYILPKTFFTCGIASKIKRLFFSKSSIKLIPLRRNWSEDNADGYRAYAKNKIRPNNFIPISMVIRYIRGRLEWKPPWDGGGPTE